MPRVTYRRFPMDPPRIMLSTSRRWNEQKQAFDDAAEFCGNCPECGSVRLRVAAENFRRNKAGTVQADAVCRDCNATIGTLTRE